MKRFAIAAALLSAALLATANPPAHTDGQNTGRAHLNSTRNKVNETVARDLPHFNANPPQKSSFTAPSLFEVGRGRVTSCSTEVPGTDKMANQECAAVNFIVGSSHPKNRFTINTNDPMLVANRGHLLNSGAVNNAATSNACTTKKIDVPAERSIESCPLWVEEYGDACPTFPVFKVDKDSNFQCDISTKKTQEYKCSRGVMPVVQEASEPAVATLNADSTVSPWDVGTFTASLTLTGRPKNFVLKRYNADNWGQLWVNGTKVYETAHPGITWTDIRNTYVQGTGRTGIFLMSPSNENLGKLIDNSCGPACNPGLTLNIDITPLMKQGANVIEMVCLNILGPGPCNAQIEGTDETATVIGTYVDNQCAALEERAKR